MSDRALKHYRFGSTFAWVNRTLRSRRKKITKIMAYLSLMKYQIGEKASKIQLTTFCLLKRHTRESFHIYNMPEALE